MTALVDNLESVGLYWLIVWTLAATAVWGAAAVIVICLRRHSAQARYRIWAVSMIIVLLSPLLRQCCPCRDGGNGRMTEKPAGFQV